MRSTDQAAGESSGADSPQQETQRVLVPVPAADFPLPLREVDYTSLPGGEAEAEQKTNALYEHDACFAPFDIYGTEPFDPEKPEAPMVHFFLVQVRS